MMRVTEFLGYCAVLQLWTISIDPNRGMIDSFLNKIVHCWNTTTSKASNDPIVRQPGIFVDDLASCVLIANSLNGSQLFKKSLVFHI